MNSRTINAKQNIGSPIYTRDCECVCVHVYIYIEREREREDARRPTTYRHIVKGGERIS